MNHPSQDHHGSQHHHEKPRRQFHKDWRVWTIVIVLLAAMAVYVLTDNEALRPAPAPGTGTGTGNQSPAPTAPKSA